MIGRVNDIPIMQFSTLITRHTQSFKLLDIINYVYLEVQT